MCRESLLVLAFFDFISAASWASAVLFRLSVVLFISVIDWESEVAAGDTDKAASEISFELWDHKCVIPRCLIDIFGSRLGCCAIHGKT